MVRQRPLSGFSGLQGMLERSNYSLRYFSLMQERTNMTKEGYLAEQVPSQNFSVLTDPELLQKDMSNTIVEVLTTSVGNDESAFTKFFLELKRWDYKVVQRMMESWARVDFERPKEHSSTSRWEQDVTRIHISWVAM